MVDYARSLLDESNPPAPTQKSATRDYAKDLIEGEQIQRHYRPTGAVSTITGKPEVEFVGEGGHGASWRAHAKAGLVDNPLIKAQIYASDRFPDLAPEEAIKRYRMKNGQYYYKGMDNKWYAENPDMLLTKLKKASTMITHPAVGMGAYGAAYGPFVAALMAMGGEGWRKTIAALVYGEEQTDVENAASMLLEGSLALAGEKAGRAILGSAHAVKRLPASRGARRVSKVMGKEADFLDLGKAAEIEKLYRDKYGVELFSGQTAESRRLLERYNFYANQPHTSGLAESAKRIQDEQAYKAVQRYWDGISKGIDPLTAGEEVQQASQKVIDRAIKEQVARARPFYQRAFSRKHKVNTAPHIKQLNEFIDTWPRTSPERKKLEKLKSMFYKEKEVLVTRKLAGFGNQAETIKKKSLVLETDFEKLDTLKKSIDTMLKPSPSDAPVDRKVKEQINHIKNNMLADMDMIDLDYQLGRQTWGHDAESLKRLKVKTHVGNIAKLEGDQVVDASKKLLRTTRNSPLMVEKVRALMIKDSPEAWDKVVRIGLEDVFNKGKEVGGMPGAEVFANFYKNTIENPNQRKIIAAAMGGERSTKFRNFLEFTDMLRRVSLISRRGPAPMKVQQGIEYGQSKLLAAATRPLYTYQRLIGDRLNELAGESAQVKLMEALSNPKAMKELRRIKRIGLKTQKGLKATTTFLSLVIGGEYVEEYRLQRSHL
jgi:hypothetical protein